MTIRPATFGDAQVLERMAVRFLEETPYRQVITPDVDRLETAIAGVLERGLVLVAEVNGTVVGMAAAMPAEHPFSGEPIVVEIAWWVEPEWRHGTLGVRLLTTLEACARSTGAKALLMIAPARSRVGQYYARRGYLEVETTFQLRLDGTR